VTKRLYQIDSYQTTFESVVLRRFPEGDRVGVVLEETCFYPTSGGQYADWGELGGQPVEDVRLDGDEIVHVLSKDPRGDRLVGNIDWTRRFDHMQQHSGQHVLSQSFLRVLNLNTVSAHVGTGVSTIELPAGRISRGDLDTVETEANRIVFECRPIRAAQMTLEEAKRSGIRKIPERGGNVRIVEIADYDSSACGGTHCRCTGEIGPIKTGRTERVRKQTRVEFLCGWRALSDHRKRWVWVEQAGAQLGRQVADLPEEVERLVREGVRAKKELARAENQLLGYRAREMLAGARVLAGVRLVESIVDDLSPERVAVLAGHLVSEPRTIALLALRTEKGHVVAARSEDLGIDVGALLSEALAQRGGRGGGKPSFGRGGIEPDHVEPVLDGLRKAVEKQIRSANRTG
jgi:alanyl-tRNA synthetase